MLTSPPRPITVAAWCPSNHAGTSKTPDALFIILIKVTFCYSKPYLRVLSGFTAPALLLKIRVARPCEAAEDVGDTRMKYATWKSFSGTMLLPDPLITYWLRARMLVKQL